MMPAVARRPEPAPARDTARYAQHVNPQWVRLLDVLGMNATYSRCVGSELHTTEGRVLLDFLSGYCVYNTGHNHPDIIEEVVDEMRRMGPNMLQSHVPLLAGELSERLCALAGGRLNRASFTSSGSEGIEAAIKFSRALTGRPGLISCHGGFHGLTNGALSLMGDPWWREGFGPLLADARQVPFGDLEALAQALAGRQVAAFIVEPVQAESGIKVPSPAYLREAQRLCREHGTLFVLDEVQTGLYRTGTFLASHQFGLDPDMVVLAKALSGGLVPVGALLLTDEINKKVFSSLSRAFVHASTFGENNLAMRAGLASLRVMEREALGDRAVAMGERLRSRLTEATRGMEMVEEIRGLGLLNGIVFRKPRRLKLRAFYEAFARVHSGMFGQMVVSHLFRRENVLTQMCGNNHMVLKAAPPLIVTAEQVDGFVAAVARCLEHVHDGYAFWKGGLAMIPRSVRA